MYAQEFRGRSIAVYIHCKKLSMQKKMHFSGYQSTLEALQFTAELNGKLDKCVTQHIVPVSSKKICEKGSLKGASIAKCYRNYMYVL